MTRILIREDQGPMEIQCGSESKWLCRCGLSKDQPWCDGSHARTRDEAPGKLYYYENGARREVEMPKSRSGKFESFMNGLRRVGAA